MLLDAHVHIDEYRNNLPTVLEQITSTRILSLAVSMDIDSYRRSKQIGETCDYIVPSFGIHPWRAPDFYEKLSTLDPLINETPMIGEIGLDHRFVDDPTAYPMQDIVFDYFLDSASKQNKIVNLHTSGAEREVVKKLEEFHISQCIIHWYNGPLNLIDRYLSAGAYFSVGVELLFSNQIRKVLDAIPNNRLLTETDNPGGYKWLVKEMGMPDHLKDVISKIAEHRKTAVSELISMVNDNFKRLIRQQPILHEKWCNLIEFGNND